MKKIIKLFAVVLLVFFAMPAVAQQKQKFHIESFSENSFDMSAREKPTSRDDGTGTLYAIIKVRSTDPDDDLRAYDLDFDYLKDVQEVHDGILWVYVQNGAKTVTVSREGFHTVERYNLRTTLQPGKVYDMKIKPEPKVAQLQVLQFKVTPAKSKAIIMYSEEGGTEQFFGQTDDEGAAAKMLVLGKYYYRVFAENYEESPGFVTLYEPGGKHTEEVVLRSNLVDIELAVEGDADIYINDKRVGSGKWNGQLSPNTYKIECRKTSHKTTIETIEITKENKEKISRTLKAPEPITGTLSVSSTPLNATIYIDGKVAGETASIISNILVGTHKVTLLKEGYATTTRNVEIKENETAVIDIELQQGGYELGKEPDAAVAAKSYLKAAAMGDADAQFNIAWCYEKGHGVAKNPGEAFKWYLKAAEQGNAKAQFNVGYCYDNGDGVPQDPYEAVKWYRKAAEQGDAAAQNNLGYCYRNGYGVSKDDFEAVKWYSKAAEQGNAKAQSNLGVCYELGCGVTKNLNEAVQLYRKAAGQGYAGAQYNLALCYYNGYGVTKNYYEAVKWYRKAAEQGNANAQFNLGSCYYDGEGVTKNYYEAVKWYRKAAEQGDAEAQTNLGFCYYNGEGVKKDISEAVRWWRKAAEQGNATAQENLKNLGY